MVGSLPTTTTILVRILRENVDRGFPERFKKAGPRAARVAEREAHGLVEQQVEKYVRDKMKPELVRTARQAQATIKRQSWR